MHNTIKYAVVYVISGINGGDMSNILYCSKYSFIDGIICEFIMYCKTSGLVMFQTIQIKIQYELILLLM